MTTKHLRITVNGKTYEVVAEILDEHAGMAGSRPSLASAPAVALAAAMAVPPVPQRASPAPSATAERGELRSPLAGKVVSIDAAVGAAVSAGQTVITLEAMKMNTLITAAGDGTVAAVLVKPGDGVEEGQLLMQIA